MASIQFTTSTTGVLLGPGVVNGVLIVGTSSPFGTGQLRMFNGASSSSGTLLAHFHSAQNTVYIPMGGLAFNTNLYLTSTAAYGGVSVFYQ